MKFDLCMFMVDIDDHLNAEWYRAAARLMLESARHAFAGHDMRVVQLTDQVSQVVEGVDIRFTPAEKCERDELMQYRGHCTAEWALQTDRPMILCDVDVLWNNDGVLQLFDPTDMPGNQVPDITLFIREGNAFQPFNGGLILTMPYQIRFWETYRAMMKVLPNDVRFWWGDQIALGVMCGTPDAGQNGAVRFGSRVAYIPINLVAPSPKSEPTRLLETSAVHFKGGDKRKPWMPAYFDMLSRNWTNREAAE